LGQVALSFVVPAYNEEESIEAVLIALCEVAKPEELEYEIVVVNDGSKDKTLSKALKYANQNSQVTVVSYRKNEGKGYAIKTGFSKAIGDIVVFADSDMEIDLETISKYVDALKKSDVVIASKWHPDSQIQMSMMRKLLSHSFNVFVRLLIGVNLKDTQVGLKVIKKSVFEDVFAQLTINRYAFDVEMLAVAKLLGLRIVEMPVKLNLNAGFRSREVLRMLIDLFSIAYKLKVRRVYKRTKNNFSVRKSEEMRKIPWKL
jgi:dolichyl-phosphate beta-glucosyltransferase